jgi:hypothetical protein
LKLALPPNASRILNERDHFNYLKLDRSGSAGSLGLDGSTWSFSQPVRSFFELSVHYRQRTEGDLKE